MQPARTCGAGPGHRTERPDPTNLPTPHAHPDASAVLLPQHRALIEASGISPEVAAERGYQSITVKAKLKVWGFSPNQCNVPALYIPIYGANGELVLHQSRPDTPRIRRGRTVKYETPKNSSMAIDVPHRVRSQIRDPKEPLFITEGVRKADSAVSHGMVCVALLGVWNWRGRNEQGGTTSLPDWEGIALKDRDIYIAFDSDVTTKSAVYDALRRLKAFLEHRGARVWIVYLPEGQAGEKIGLDDFLAGGKSRDDVLALARRELPPRPVDPAELDVVRPEYRATARGLVRVQFDEDMGETLILLTTFTCEIRASVFVDDGVATTQYLELAVTCAGLERHVEVLASRFSSMDWVAADLDSTHVILAGLSARDHARAAIQVLSPAPATKRVYAHTGWRQLRAAGAARAQWAFLHAGGAIGAAGTVPGVGVRLPEALEKFVLPDPPVGSELEIAVRAVLARTRLAPDRISLLILGTTFRCVLGNTDFSVHLTGPTGAFKTAMAALHQQSFGKGMDANSLPGNWSSTANALEALAFAAKDVVFVIDEFVPQGGLGDVQRLHRDADRVLRAQGNHSGRQRLTADGTHQRARPPRGMILSTGEETPQGHSLRARLLVIELAPGDVDKNELTRCQRDGGEGLYAAAMAAFVQWLAGRRDDLDARVRARITELRALVARESCSSHQRTVEMVASIYVGVEYFFEFATSTGGITRAESDEWMRRSWNALVLSGSSQAELLASADVVERFIALLKSALTSGEAHLVDEKGDEPRDCPPGSTGWHVSSSVSPGTRVPRGSTIGLVLDREVFLDPHAAMRVVQKLTDDSGRIAISTRTLGKRLAERGYLAKRDEMRGKTTVRRQVAGVRRDLLHLLPHVLLERAHEAHEAQAPTLGCATADSEPTEWASMSPVAGPSSPEPGPAKPPAAGSGPAGPGGPLPDRDPVTSGAGEGVSAGEEEVIL